MNPPKCDELDYIPFLIVFLLALRAFPSLTLSVGGKGRVGEVHRLRSGMSWCEAKIALTNDRYLIELVATA
ncbi:MAG: hypothetical protein KatS3mg022_3252 [Armatimonadota bacterium]|nr:MAG: hypothetical protein KatS3mg022_3252 [Armatimonadota bacterium]